MKPFQKMPSYSTWKSKSSAWFALRSSDSVLKQIDDLVKLYHQRADAQMEIAFQIYRATHYWLKHLGGKVKGADGRIVAIAHLNGFIRNEFQRVFDDGSSSPTNLEQTIANVLVGFKKMTSTMNGCNFVITDMPKDRADPDKELTEAYVFNLTEKPKTVYVEKAFFENYDVSVLHDQKKNWARIIVHEVSHIDAATEGKSYAYQGIGVGTSLTPAQAAVNADTWAFFAADCGGALTSGDILRAGAGTGGNLTKKPKNWL